MWIRLSDIIKRSEQQGCLRSIHKTRWCIIWKMFQRGFSLWYLVCLGKQGERNQRNIISDLKHVELRYAVSVMKCEDVVTYAFETSWRVSTDNLRETSWWFQWSRVGSFGVLFEDPFVSVAFVFVCTSVSVCVDTLSEGWRVTELLVVLLVHGCLRY